MSSIAKPVAGLVRLPRFRFSWPRLSWHRKQTTIELSHASPHLLRDIGLADHYVRTRAK